MTRLTGPVARGTLLPASERPTIRRGFIAAVVLTAAIAGAEDDRSSPSISKWQAIFCGIDWTELQASSPRLMRGYAMRVDLSRSDLEFVATPSNGEREGEVDGLKPSTFLADTVSVGSRRSFVEDSKIQGRFAFLCHGSRANFAKFQHGSNPS